MSYLSKKKKKDSGRCPETGPGACAPGPAYRTSFCFTAKGGKQKIQYKENNIMSKNGKGCSGNTHTQSQMNHHANQCNPNNSAHTAAMNNHANQCNPNHNASKR